MIYRHFIRLLLSFVLFNLQGEKIHGGSAFLCFIQEFTLPHAIERLKSRGILWFTSIKEALDVTKERKLENQVVFVHSGTYQKDFLILDHDVSIIGASSGDFCGLQSN